MTLNEYQRLAGDTDADHPVDYYIHGLCNESGEAAGVRKRELRGDEDVGDMRKELGDSLWYLARTAKKYGFSLEDVALENLEKLRKRAREGKIAGKGDDR